MRKDTMKVKVRGRTEILIKEMHERKEARELFMCVCVGGGGGLGRCNRK